MATHCYQLAAARFLQTAAIKKQSDGGVTSSFSSWRFFGVAAFWWLPLPTPTTTSSLKRSEVRSSSNNKQLSLPPRRLILHRYLLSTLWSLWSVQHSWKDGSDPWPGVLLAPPSGLHLLLYNIHKSAERYKLVDINTWMFLPAWPWSSQVGQDRQEAPSLLRWKWKADCVNSSSDMKHLSAPSYINRSLKSSFSSALWLYYDPTRKTWSRFTPTSQKPAPKNTKLQQHITWPCTSIKWNILTDLDMLMLHL